ncbi:replication initiation protein (plasmid) [Halomonas sediminis]
MFKVVRNKKQGHRMSICTDSPQVYKANALIEASYRLSLYEQRILLACISQVRRDQPITDTILYSVTASQVAEMSGADVKTAYRDLKSASERLFERRVTIHEAPNGKGKVSTLLTRWVQSVRYVESEGRIELRFSKDMLPYLTELTEQFTKYALADVARMTSGHSIRIYEMLMQWQGTGEREVSMDWLRKSLQLEGRYPSFKDFRRRVIEPSIEQINEHSPVWVKWDQRKAGRKVTHLRFIFGLKSQVDNKKADERKKTKRLGGVNDDLVAGIPKSVIDQYANPGESYALAAARLHAERREGKGSW